MIITHKIKLQGTVYLHYVVTHMENRCFKLIKKMIIGKPVFSISLLSSKIYDVICRLKIPQDIEIDLLLKTLCIYGMHSGFWMSLK